MTAARRRAEDSPTQEDVERRKLDHEVEKSQKCSCDNCRGAVYYRSGSNMFVTVRKLALFEKRRKDVSIGNHIVPSEMATV